MQRAETPEFSIAVDPRFAQVRILGTAIALRSVPETLFSPQMSVWTIDAEPGADLARVLVKQLDGKLIEQRDIDHAGMHGVFGKAKDKLADERNRKRDWYRLRALLVSADGASWYMATAMCAADDLAEIEASLFRTLDSIEITQVGAAASEAHRASDAAMDAALAGFGQALDGAAAEHRRREDAAQAEAALAPVASVEARFDQALAAVDATHLRDKLRPLARPIVSVAEAGPAPLGETGGSRIGGGPDLPAGMEWPRDESGFHRNFLAQIDLGDLPDRPEPLPETGLLSIFSGTDFIDWLVLYTPAGAPLVAHSLPEDAEAQTIAAANMVVWDSEASRMVLTTHEKAGLVGAVEPDGRLRFLRDGAPVLALASEYEISRAVQRLRFDRALWVPRDSEAYDGIGLDDPYDFTDAIREAFRIGASPRHQMFGDVGIQQPFADFQAHAARHAEEQGWTGLERAEDWFLLLKLASGGKADFCFGDAGDYLVLANRRDTARGDFTRVYAMMDSS